MKVFPNPADDNLNVEVINDRNTIIVIHNIKGEVFYYSSIKNSQSIDVSDFPSGMYLVSAISGEKVDRKKFVKN